jgi:general secretion pathway protein A
MYEDYYGLTENPFSLTPDPKYHFRSATHTNAFELVQYGIRRREGVIAITGDSGTGKTILCRTLLEHLDRTVLTALVLTPLVSEEELLRVVLQEFGVVSRQQGTGEALPSVGRQALIDTLNGFLLSLPPLGAQALIVIDEAQNLPPRVLEEIRLLSNFETDKQKLVQVLLVGQSNLRETLRKPERRQLDQRISVRHELKPLSREETAAYVAHRLAIAGGDGAISFSAGAIARVHGCTRGVPRLVNLLCDRALLAACADRTVRVLSGHIDRAAEALDLARPGRLLLAWAR